VRSVREVMASLALWVLLAAFAVTPLAAQTENRSAAGVAPTDAEVGRAIDTVKADPNLSTTRQIKTLRWKDRAAPRPTDQPAWILWIVGLFRWFNQAARVVVWFAAALAAGFLGVFIYRIVQAHGGPRQQMDSSHLLTFRTLISDPSLFHPTSVRRRVYSGTAASIALRWRCCIGGCSRVLLTCTASPFETRLPKVIVSRWRQPISTAVDTRTHYASFASGSARCTPTSRRTRLSSTTSVMASQCLMRLRLRRALELRQTRNRHPCCLGARLARVLDRHEHVLG